MKKPKYSITLKNVTPGMLFTDEHGDFRLVLSVTDYFVVAGDFYDRNQIREVGTYLINLCEYEKITKAIKGNIKVVMRIVSSEYDPAYILYSNTKLR